ncbi:MAG: hypothetical protein HOP29_04515 [Phycisphaerales bacterium]|nr:hypothetical protein [Phycisphaerales bacterium]
MTNRATTGPDSTDSNGGEHGALDDRSSVGGGIAAGERPRLWSPRHSLWFVLAIVLAGVLRLVALDRHPEPVNEDELSNIYDGWSIAETGADRAGRRWPILCRGWGPGDNRPALMAWLCAGVSAFTGFSVGGCRAVSGVVGTITVALVAWWGVGVAGRRIALLGSLLLAVSPWHLLYSRLAHEGTALPGLFAVAIVLLLRSAAMANDRVTHSTWRWAAAGLVIGLSTNAYGATRLTGLLFAVLAAAVVVASCWRRESRLRSMLAPVGGIAFGALIGAGPQIWASWTDYDAFVGRARMTQTAFFGWLDAVETIGGSVVANLSPRYLFYSFGEPDRLAAGRCSIVALPLFYAGLIWLCVPWSGIRWYDRVLLLAGLLICACPPAFTRANVHSLRASGCAVLIPMICVVGLVPWGRLGAWMIGMSAGKTPEWAGGLRGAGRDSRTSDRTSGIHGPPALRAEGREGGIQGLKSLAKISRPPGEASTALGVFAQVGRSTAAHRGRVQNTNSEKRGDAIADAATAACAMLILIAGAWYVGRFTGDAHLRSVFHQPHMVALGRWLTPRMNNYDRVYVVARGNQPDIYLAAFTGMTPREFQSAERPVWGERNEYAHRLNRFHIARFLKDVYDDRRAANPNERWLVVDAHRTMMRELGPAPNR